ncbi:MULTISPECIES: type II toxin-antitoxin system VapC family toxin [Methylobacterium]|jgi:predicted nucleic acid-binding protein|uniref:type II toxin-antitoxin system VapC family toxin n=1 Tax=Methylobacterium TaxID=407 RepID=UPI0011C71066|nr:MULTISPECIES: type II toxin-antitoxin system VapC family toxin [Methylobacterium]TXN48345.1 type II toxin-antitoxin system VapC family toxin [Methylobacterium sp. WL7]GJE19929.1 tRNA(fMet)-specific endonuclease VapC [Methylobacterium mesophilicum]
MIVIDACVAAKWFLPEPQSDLADAILLEDVARIAPEHILVEVGNTLLRNHRSGAITLEHAREAISALGKLVRLRPILEIADTALSIASSIGCTHYDALYVAAAERWDSVLVTADARLVRQLQTVQWTGRYRLLGP